jgi:hypothetical protein
MADTEILKNPLLLVSGDRSLIRLIALECRELALPMEVSDTLPGLAKERPMLLDLDSAGVMEALAAAGGEFVAVAGICRDLTRLPAEVQARFSVLLQRPVPTRRLRALLGQLGGRSEMAYDDGRDDAHREPVSASNIVLEMMGDDLKLGDSTVHLTPSEAAILRLLVARRGEAVSREELRETLKGHGESNKLEVYLCFLRRKIERPLGLHMITTVRGVGYRLE